MTDTGLCEATYKEWGCNLLEGHTGPHEAWGFKIMCSWGPSPRSPVREYWRDYLVQDLSE